MMREEFEQRTGFYPNQALYVVIEKYYVNSTDDKDTFCKAYKENDGWLATKIQHEADMQMINTQIAAEKSTNGYESRIAELEKALECEQEWKPYEDTNNVQQGDYERLAGQSDTNRMSDEKAKDLLYDWYGFAREKINIHHNVPVYEVNRHGRMRKIGKLDRSPLYNTTDWNYIRFDCGCMSYELYNDNLRPYIH